MKHLLLSGTFFATILCVMPVKAKSFITEKEGYQLKYSPKHGPFFSEKLVVLSPDGKRCLSLPKLNYETELKDADLTAKVTFTFPKNITEDNKLLEILKTPLSFNYKKKIRYKIDKYKNERGKKCVRVTDRVFYTRFGGTTIERGGPYNVGYKL